MPDLGEGDRVMTVRPSEESHDWHPFALAARRWGVVGTIISRSDAHGLIFLVEHEDQHTAWYDPRELTSLRVGEEGAAK